MRAGWRSSLGKLPATSLSIDHEGGLDVLETRCGILWNLLARIRGLWQRLLVHIFRNSALDYPELRLSQPTLPCIGAIR